MRVDSYQPAWVGKMEGFKSDLTRIMNVRCSNWEAEKADVERRRRTTGRRSRMEIVDSDGIVVDGGVLELIGGGA